MVSCVHEQILHFTIWWRENNVNIFYKLSFTEYFQYFRCGQTIYHHQITHGYRFPHTSKLTWTGFWVLCIPLSFCTTIALAHICFQIRPKNHCRLICPNCFLHRIIEAWQVFPLTCDTQMFCNYHTKSVYVFVNL